MPPGQWVFVPGLAATPKPPLSGLRIAAGIAAIVLGVWGVLPAYFQWVHNADFVGFFEEYDLMGVYYWTMFNAALLIACSVGSAASGIVLLAKSRSRKRIVPIVVGAIAALELVPLLTLREAVVVEVISYLLIATIVVLAVLSLVLESKKWRTASAGGTSTP
jgi:hypothetical protein